VDDTSGIVSNSKTDLDAPKKNRPVFQSPTTTEAYMGNANTPGNVRRRSKELIERHRVEVLGRSPGHFLAPAGTFPVDIVITWYNSDDEVSTQRYTQRLSEVNKDDLPFGTTDRKRHTDAGELRYNLRGLEKYAGAWVRNIHIVVADDMELPGWLNTDDKNLKIVRHRQIFQDAKDLPTFNSHAIEANLHRIPGLAENFLYANDDMFMNNVVVPQTFFTPGGSARVWTGGYRMQVEKLLDGHSIAVKNTLDILKAKIKLWRLDADNTLNHNIKPLTISMMRRAEELYGERFHATQTHPFRHRQDVWPILLASIVCVEEGHCPMERPPRSYLANIDKDKSPSAAMREIAKENPTLICLNDSHDGLANELESQLMKLFPEPSRFEK